MSNVTETSKKAYNTVNLTTQRERVAECLLQRTFAMRLTSDRDVSEATGIPLSQIPARRDELIEFKYQAHGELWMPAMMPNRYNRRTGRTCQTWSMVIYSYDGNMLDMKRETLNFITKFKMK